MTAATADHTIPTGTLKQLKLTDITIGERFRKDFTDDAQFIESIREKGILQPITVDKEYNLLAGERRYRAAQTVGLEKIPALVRAIEGEVDAREIEFIENIFRKDFTWQEQTRLVCEIDRLYREKDVDWTIRKTATLINQSKTNVHRALDLGKALTLMPELEKEVTAHDAFKIYKGAQERILLEELSKRRTTELAKHVEVAEGEQAAAAVEGAEPSKYSPEMAARLKMADLNYRIGDIFEELAKFQDNGVINLIECDPPYGVDFKTIRGGDRASTPNYNANYEEVPEADYPAFLSKLTRELYRVANKDAWMIFWFASKQHTLVRQTLEESGWSLDEVPALWVKPAGQTMRPELLLSRNYEPFFVCYKGVPYIHKRGRSNVFQFAMVSYAQKCHPTERPVELIEELLDTFGVPGQYVLVPFLGSGNTLRACYRLGRKGFGYDINPEYKDRFMLSVEADAHAIIGKEKSEPASPPPAS